MYASSLVQSICGMMLLWSGKREKPPICLSERPWFPQDRFMEPRILPGRKPRLLRQVKVVNVFGLVKCQVHWCGQSECRESESEPLVRSWRRIRMNVYVYTLIPMQHVCSCTHECALCSHTLLCASAQLLLSALPSQFPPTVLSASQLGPAFSNNSLQKMIFRDSNLPGSNDVANS